MKANSLYCAIIMVIATMAFAVTQVSAQSTKPNGMSLMFINDKTDPVYVMPHSVYSTSGISTKLVMPGGAVTFELAKPDSVPFGAPYEIPKPDGSGGVETNDAGDTIYQQVWDKSARVCFSLGFTSNITEAVQYEQLKFSSNPGTVTTVHIVNDKNQGLNLIAGTKPKHKYIVLETAIKNTYAANTTSLTLKVDSGLTKVFAFTLNAPGTCLNGLTLAKGEESSVIMGASDASNLKLTKTGIIKVKITYIETEGGIPRDGEIFLPIPEGKKDVTIKITDDYFKSTKMEDVVPMRLTNKSKKSIWLFSGAYDGKSTSMDYTIAPGETKLIYVKYGSNFLDFSYTLDDGSLHTVKGKSVIAGNRSSYRIIVDGKNLAVKN